MEVELLNTIEIKGKKYGVVEEGEIQDIMSSNDLENFLNSNGISELLSEDEITCCSRCGEDLVLLRQDIKEYFIAGTDYCCVNCLGEETFAKRSL